MTTIKFWRRALIAVAIYVVLATMYVSTNFWTVYRNSSLVYMEIDTWIPFVADFFYIYVFGYLFLLAYPIIFITNRQNFYQLAKGATWIILTTGIIYVLFPTKMQRPQFNVIDHTTFFMSVFYKIDPPHNSFPSIHVSLSTFIAVFLHRHKIFCNYSLIIAALVNLSTVLTKQHALIDVAGGLFHCFLALTLFDQFKPIVLPVIKNSEVV